MIEVPLKAAQILKDGFQTVHLCKTHAQNRFWYIITLCAYNHT